MERVALRVEVPIACFRQSRSREYIETYTVPPPATVYGMLLSLIGEPNRYRHCGVRLAICLLANPQVSVVLRKFHRHKSKDLIDPANIRPDFQELLTHVRFIVFLEQGEETEEPCLTERILAAFQNPSGVARFGGLSLGESQFLINSVTLVTKELQDETGDWLVEVSDGPFSLPYWVDHVGSRNTCWQRYALQRDNVQEPPPASWTGICSL
jgi:CRISPR-associated protein Cas5t